MLNETGNSNTVPLNRSHFKINLVQNVCKSNFWGRLTRILLYFKVIIWCLSYIVQRILVWIRIYSVIQSHYIASFHIVLGFYQLLRHDIVCYIQLFSINKCLLFQPIWGDVLLSLFVPCAELLAAMASCLGQPTVCLQSVGQVKLFIEQLSPYIAQGRLSPLPPWSPPY